MNLTDVKSITYTPFMCYKQNFLSFVTVVIHHHFNQLGPIFQHSRLRDSKELQALDDTLALQYHDNGGSAEDFPCENNPQLLLFHNIVLTGRLIRHPQVTACFILCLDLSASNICNKMANMGCIPFNSFNMFNSNFPSMTCKQPMLPFVSQSPSHGGSDP